MERIMRTQALGDARSLEYMKVGVMPLGLYVNGSGIWLCTGICCPPNGSEGGGMVCVLCVGHLCR